MMLWRILNSLMVVLTLAATVMGLYLIRVTERRRRRLTDNPSTPAVLVYSATRAIRQEQCFLLLRIALMFVAVFSLAYEPLPDGRSFPFYIASTVARMLIVLLTGYMSWHDLTDRGRMHKMLNERNAASLRAMIDEMEQRERDKK